MSGSVLVHPLSGWAVFGLGALGGFISYTIIFWFPWALRMASGTVTSLPDKAKLIGLGVIGLFAVCLGGFVALGLGEVTATRQAIVGGLAWPAFIKTVGDIGADATDALRLRAP